MDKIGVLFDSNFGLLVKNGRLQIGNVSDQNQKLLLLIGKGEIKDSPTRCVGASRYIESDKVDDLAREIRLQFSQDGMRVNSINVDLPNIEIDAEYV